MDVFGIPGIYSDPDIHGGQPVIESGIPLSYFGYAGPGISSR